MLSVREEEGRKTEVGVGFIDPNKKFCNPIHEFSQQLPTTWDSVLSVILGTSTLSRNILHDPHRPVAEVMFTASDMPDFWTGSQKYLQQSFFS